jgi:hypothetical protein
MKKPVLTGAVILILFIFTSCGNLVNDELLNESEPLLPDETGSSFGAVLAGRFSTSGKVLVSSTGGDGYFLSATIKDENDKDNIWLSYIDNNGRTKWSARLQNSGTDDLIRRIEVIDNDNILLFADRFYPAEGNPDIIIAKVNSSSGITWQRCFGSENKNLVYGSLLASDGGFLLTGITGINKTETDPAILKPYVLRLDKNGNVLWKKDYNNLNKIVFPAELISLGNDEYLLSGTTTNPANNKITGFYCVIDGSSESAGKIKKTSYIKLKDADISMLGCISNGENITSVIAVKSETADEFSVLSMDKKKLKLSSRKSYSFSDFHLQGAVVNEKNDSFLLTGMIKYNKGNGIYAIRFGMDGSIRELQTRYYDDNGYKFITPGFNKSEEDSKITFISRLDNPGVFKHLFIDRFPVYSSLKYSPSKIEVIISDGTENVDTGLDEEDVEVEAEDSVIAEKANPGLIFERYKN